MLQSGIVKAGKQNVETYEIMNGTENSIPPPTPKRVKRHSLKLRLSSFDKSKT